MQDGDLEEYHPDALVVVLEGVLCMVSQDVEKIGLLRKSMVTTSMQWMDLPIKRLITLARQYPNTKIEVITFLDEAAASRATEFLDRIGFPYPAVRYTAIDDFVFLLPYSEYIRAVYDSDEARLERYGQVGVGVAFGSDWMAS